MRAVADSLGVRPASLYKHVGDLAGLEALLADASAEALQSAMATAIASMAVDRGTTPDTADLLLTAASAYLTFARQSPARYSMLVTPYERGATDSRKALWNQLLSIVGASTGNADDTDGAIAVWAFMHGFVQLEQAGMLGPSGHMKAFTRGLIALEAGLKLHASV